MARATAKGIRAQDRGNRVTVVSASQRNRRHPRPARVLCGLALAQLLSTAAAADDRGPAAARASTHDERPLSGPSPPSEPQSRWTLSAETILLGRSGTSHQPLVSLVPGNVPWLTLTGANTSNTPGVEVLNSSQLGQRLAAGARLSLAYRDPAGYGLALSYVGVPGLKAVRSTGPEIPAQWLVMKAPGSFWQTQDYSYQSMVWRDDTRLHSLEAEARVELSPRTTLSLGVRWLQLRDQLQGTLTPDDLGEPAWKLLGAVTLPNAVPLANSAVVVNPPFWTTTTVNNLYGLQVGARSELWQIGRLSVEGLVKAGLYDNRSRQTTVVSMAKQLYPASAATSAAAFVAEGRLVAKYRLTGSVTLKLGFDALWFDGVALAPAQIQKVSTTQTSVSASGVDHRGTTLLRGMSFGLDYAF